MWQGDTQYASPNYISRSQLYGVTALPTAQFGGYLQDVGGGDNVNQVYQRYVQKYNQVANDNSPLSIIQTTSISGQNLIIQANIQVTNSITTSNNKVEFILTRYQDSDYFCSVVAYDDIPFSLTEVGETGVYEGIIPINQDWDMETLKAVAIVQSFSGNKQILQASMTDISLDNMLILNSELNGILNDTDGDFVVNPGETIDLSFTVRNESLLLSADNIVGTFSTENENVTIQNSVINISDLMDVDDEVLIEFEFEVNSEITLGEFDLNLTLEADYIDLYEDSYTYIANFNYPIDVSLNQQNWPMFFDAEIKSSPVVKDINGDGSNEVIFGDGNGLLHVVDIDGNELEGFPFDLEDTIWGSPAVADLENDGDLEIVIGSKDQHLFILNSDGSEQADYNAHQSIMGTTALGNIDDDEDLEIIFGGYSGAGFLFAINPDGSDVQGFPVEVDEKIQKGIALADFDGNNKMDIIFGTNDKNLYLLSDNGEEIWSQPFEVGDDIRCAPVVLQLSEENNSDKIILVGSRDNSFYGINADGSLRFSIETGGNVEVSPGVVDIEGIGPVIFFGSDDEYLYAVLSNGEALDGWPIHLGGDIISSPVFADLDADGEVEVVTSTSLGDLVAMNLDGSFVDYFPINYNTPFAGAPTVVDRDNDGDLEIFAGTSTDMVCVDVKEVNGSIDNYWSIFRGNELRTGYFISNEPVNYVSNNIFELPENFGIQSVYPNPFNPTTTIGFTIPMAETHHNVSIQIFNLHGKLIETLVNVHLEAGYHQITWNGSNRPSGLYFVKMRTGEFVNTQKVLLLK